MLSITETTMIAVLVVCIFFAVRRSFGIEPFGCPPVYPNFKWTGGPDYYWKFHEQGLTGQCDVTHYDPTDYKFRLLRSRDVIYLV